MSSQLCPPKIFNRWPHRRWSIIAASCCPGVMRWAGLLRHSEHCLEMIAEVPESRIRVESNGVCQSRLALVEGPEFLCLQFQRTCYVERVERANA